MFASYRGYAQPRALLQRSAASANSAMQPSSAFQSAWGRALLVGREQGFPLVRVKVMVNEFIIFPKRKRKSVRKANRPAQHPQQLTPQQVQMIGCIQEFTAGTILL